MIKFDYENEIWVGTLEYHYEMVVNRISERMRNGERTEDLHRYLKWCGWDEYECDDIISKAKEKD